jgi:hypothetical protein
MSIQLEQPIRTYFDISNGAHGRSLADCFTPDAVVFDEGGRHQGLDAIQSWKQAARKKFDYSVEPLSAAKEGGHVAVVANVVGNFPGSPVQLTHSFQLDGDKISSLEIK